MKKDIHSEWDPAPAGDLREIFDRKIRFVASNSGWRHAVRLMQTGAIPLQDMNVAEVGCGTGTFALTMSLLGASVTLVDLNEKVLVNAKKIFEAYSCKADLVQADCTSPAPEKLRGKFDTVFSLGLAEHFTKEKRIRCVDFHRQLVRPGGFVYLGVPNWIHRAVHQLLNMWGISVEIPFSDRELMKIARTLGFEEYYVIGNSSLLKDFVIYGRGIVSALSAALPGIIRDKIREYAKKMNGVNVSSKDSLKEIRVYLSERALKSIEKTEVLKNRAANKFSAGIILIAFK